MTPISQQLTLSSYGNAISKKRSHSQVNHNDSDEEEDDDDEDKTGSPSVSRNKKEPETISDSTKAPLHLDADGSEIEDDDQFPKGHAASFRPIGPKHVAPPAKRVKQTADSPHGPPDSSASSQLDGKPGQATRNVHVSGINGYFQYICNPLQFYILTALIAMSSQVHQKTLFSSVTITGSFQHFLNPLHSTY